MQSHCVGVPVGWGSVYWMRGAARAVMVAALAQPVHGDVLLFAVALG